jgi:hypothetical protein
MPSLYVRICQIGLGKSWLGSHHVAGHPSTAAALEANEDGFVLISDETRYDVEWVSSWCFGRVQTRCRDKKEWHRLVTLAKTCFSDDICMHVCMYVCMYVCMCSCTYCAFVQHVWDYMLAEAWRGVSMCVCARCSLLSTASQAGGSRAH